MVASLNEEHLENYLVWFDPLLEDYFWMEEGQMTEKFRATLEAERVEFKAVSAATPTEALEKMFPKHKERAVSPRRMQ